MDAAVLIARLILAAVLGIAGIAKLLRPSASRDAMRAFGVPAAVVPVVAVLVPALELIVAGALVPAVTAGAAAVVAFLMLAAFTLAVGINLARGRAPACGCFGVVSSNPIGPRTIARNLVLMALAAFVAVGEAAGRGAGLGPWFGGLTTAGKAGVLFAAALVVAIAIPVIAARAESETLEPPDDDLSRYVDDEEDEDDEEWGLPVGQPAPPFQLLDVAGAAVTLASLLSVGRPVLLVFAAPSCQSCAALMPDVAAWERDLDGALTVAVVSSDATAGEGAAHEYGLRAVLADTRREVADAYRTVGTPAAVVVGVDGRVATDTAHGADEIHSLMDRELWKVVPPVTG